MTALYAVRVLSRDGRYPSTPLVIQPFGILAADDFAWSAVRLSEGGVNYSPTRERLGAPTGEISWLTPQEIRFFAAATLAEAHPRTNGSLRILTRDWYKPLELDEPFTPARLVAESRAMAWDTFTHLEMIKGQDGSELDEPDSGRKPEALERDYTAEAKGLLDQMDVTDPLLHRGLYKLLMAVELNRHAKFLEEAMLSALTSREAALELLRRKLSTAGGERWKLDDVLVHIAETFPTGEPFAEVLQSDWAARVVIAHPVSEHGEHWSPPVEAEECWDALRTLTYLYRYLLLDEIWEPAEYD
jgi:hypothetical protein